jgi:hypothetical protein
VTAVAAAGAASAGAATVDVGASSSSATSIRLDATFTKSLRAKGIRLTAGRPATLRGATLRLPVSRTRITASQTRLTHTGTLRLRTAKRSVTLTGWRTTVTPSGLSMSAVVAKKRRTLFSVKGGKIATDATTGRTTITGSTVRLTGAGASALRASLRVTGLRAGVVGRATAKATPATPLPTPARPAPAPAPAPAPPAPTPPAPVDPGPAAPGDPCATDVTAQTAGLTWAVRTSFLIYVQSPVAKGTVTTCDGAAAERDAAGKASLAYFSPTGTAAYQPDTGEVSVAVAGSIHFQGHDTGKGPQLDMRFENLRIRSLDGQTGQLVADVTSREFGGMNPGAEPPTATVEQDVTLAELSLADRATTAPDGVRTWKDVPATLTDEGAAAFGGFYPAGDPLAPLTFRAYASTLDWTQTNVYGSAPPAGQPVTNRTWLGYVTNPTPFSGAQGTFTPSAGASGPTVTKTSPRTTDNVFTTRFAVVSNTVSAATKTGVVRLRGLVTFFSPGPAPSAGHDFTVTVKDPRIVFDGSATAKLYATGIKSPGTGQYDESRALFDLAVSAVTDNGNGTSTFSGLAPSIVEGGYAFPENYATGAGPERTPNTFGSFALTVPTATE